MSLNVKASLQNPGSAGELESGERIGFFLLFCNATDKHYWHVYGLKRVCIDTQEIIFVQIIQYYDHDSGHCN